MNRAEFIGSRSRLPCVLLLVALLGLSACGDDSGGDDSGGDGGGGDTTGSTETGSSDTVPSDAAVLEWSKPSSKMDGTALSDLASFRIYYGTSPGQYDQTVDIDSETTSYRFDGLEPGSYYFAVVAVDESANESPFSREVSKTIQ